MPARDIVEEEKQKARATLHEVMELAARFFQDCLNSPSGASARGYLRQRGLTSVTIQRFRLGYAPDSRNALKSYLAERGVEKALVEACGLVVYGPDIPVSYDRFRDRVMFPIEDARGRVIAFGGRALSSDVPAKYLNSPETELFQKGHLLYNFSRARDAARSSGSVLVVEGYMDVIALAQAGIDCVVAPLGTALTEHQLELAWRISPEPIICFDGDAAGARAAFRAIDVCFPRLRSGYSLRFAALPVGKDPDDLVKEDGRESFLDLMRSAIPLHEFFFLRRAQFDSDISPEKMAKIENDLYSDVNLISDATVKRYYRSHLRLRLYEAFGRARPLPVSERPQVFLDRLGMNLLQRMLLGLCVEYPGLLTDYVEEISKVEFASTELQLFAQELHRIYVVYEDLSMVDLYEKIDSRFRFVIEAIHGSDKTIRTRENRHGVYYKYQVRRGHKLRALFPMLRLEPPYETIKQTMAHLLLEIEVRKIREHYINAVSELSVEQFEAFQRQMEYLESRRSQSEIELDQEFQALAGRHNRLVA